jgi:hypothetical protein
MQQKAQDVTVTINTTLNKHVDIYMTLKVVS